MSFTRYCKNILLRQSKEIPSKNTSYKEPSIIQFAIAIFGCIATPIGLAFVIIFPLIFPLLGYIGGALLAFGVLAIAFAMETKPSYKE